MQSASAVGEGTSEQLPVAAARVRLLSLVLTCLLAAGVMTTDKADWQPFSLVVALGVAMIVADVMSVSARRFRISVSLTVQVAAMALSSPITARCTWIRRRPKSTGPRGCRSSLW